MDLRPFGVLIAADYDRAAQQYRRDDEVEVRTENHQRLGGNLRRICRSFGHPVRVLELGCGTGRYFHWLEDVELLVGTDLSAEMLKRAERPVRHEAVTAAEVRLLRANLYDLSFEPGSFDFIYSLGVFGHGAALNGELAMRIAGWLAPGGRLYFDAIEKRELGRTRELRKSMKSAVRPFLPPAVRRRLAAREAASIPLLQHTRADLEAIMEGTSSVSRR